MTTATRAPRSQTSAGHRRIGYVVAILVVGIVLNALYIAADPPRLRALGDIVTMTVGIAVLARIWQVFPFDFGDAPSPWDTVVRVLVALGIVGSAIGIVVALVTLVRGGPRRG